MGKVRQRIEEKLQAAFLPSILQVEDDSAKHHGHAGAQPEGESHFSVKIISPLFAGKSRVQCHRMIYEALAEELASSVHALAIDAQGE